jgi:hypothetical protein
MHRCAAQQVVGTRAAHVGTCDQQSDVRTIGVLATHRKAMAEGFKTGVVTRRASRQACIHFGGSAWQGGRIGHGIASDVVLG